MPCPYKNDNRQKGRKTKMDEERIAAYDKLINKLLQASPDEHPQILNAHSDLLDSGLLQKIIAVSQ